MEILAEMELLFVLFLIVVFFLLGDVAIFGNFLLLVFIVFVVIIIFGNDVQMDGMDLRNFQFRLALWATENLAFFDFVFVDVDFGGTFRAADHGFHPPYVIQTVGAAKTASTTVERIIYRREVNPIRASCSDALKLWGNGYTAYKWRPRGSIRHGRWSALAA
jgi:hypothetical protein